MAGFKRTYQGDSMAEHLDPDGLVVLERWRHWRADRRLPRKRDLEPLDFPSALPGIRLVEVTEGPSRFRYRLVGTREVDIGGWDPTGRTVTEGFLGPDLPSVLKKYETVVEHCIPICTVDLFRKQNGVEIVDTCLFLPFSADGSDNVDYVLAYCFQRPPTEAERS